MATLGGGRVLGWADQRWRGISDNLAWTAPTSTEVAVVAKSALAAGVAWWIAGSVIDVPAPVLASLTAVVVVQVSARSSLRAALQRSVAVVLGVLLALAIGDALSLNGITVAALVAASLGVAQLALRLPPAAARQVPISGLVVLTAVSLTPETSAWHRTADTLIGAAVGVAISLVLPASRLVDARQTVDRLAESLGVSLDGMGQGLQHEWATTQTETWRRVARTTRVRLVEEAKEAIGNSRETAQWNFRDRRHVDVLRRYEELLPRLERTAIGVSVIARGLDDHARLTGASHQAMPALGALLVALADVVRSLARGGLERGDQGDVAAAIAELRIRRAACVRGAGRRARIALDQSGTPVEEQFQREWLGYAALLVQVDRIVDDLSAPLPQ